MRRVAQFVGLGTVLGLILSAIFIWGVSWFPTEGSQQSSNNFPLFIAITYVSFVIFAIVIVAMGYSLWKFRRRGPSDMRDGEPTHGNTLLELSWTGAALLIVVFFAVWGAKVLDDNEAHARQRPRDHGPSRTATRSTTATTPTAASHARTGSTCPSARRS